MAPDFKLELLEEDVQLPKGLWDQYQKPNHLQEPVEGFRWITGSCAQCMDYDEQNKLYLVVEYFMHYWIERHYYDDEDTSYVKEKPRQEKEADQLEDPLYPYAPGLPDNAFQ